MFQGCLIRKTHYVWVITGHLHLQNQWINERFAALLGNVEHLGSSAVRTLWSGRESHLHFAFFGTFRETEGTCASSDQIIHKKSSFKIHFLRKIARFNIQMLMKHAMSDNNAAFFKFRVNFEKTDPTNQCTARINGWSFFFNFLNVFLNHSDWLEHKNWKYQWSTSHSVSPESPSFVHSPDYPFAYQTGIECTYVFVVSFAF